MHVVICDPAMPARADGNVTRAAPVAMRKPGGIVVPGAAP
jgi:hypothetical protein